MNKKFDRRPPAAKDSTQLNEDIRDISIRLIGSDGEMIGVMSPKEALEIAMSQNLDLVKIVENADPPVCKIMDYGKFRYEKQKKEKEMKKNQKVVTVKEVRLSVGIEKHDFETKARNAVRFLEDGDRVKISLKMWGRQLANPQAGIDIVNEFVDHIREQFAVTQDGEPKFEGKSVSCVISKAN